MKDGRSKFDRRIFNARGADSISFRLQETIQQRPDGLQHPVIFRAASRGWMLSRLPTPVQAFHDRKKKLNSQYDELAYSLLRSLYHDILLAALLPAAPAEKASTMRSQMRQTAVDEILKRARVRTESDLRSQPLFAKTPIVRSGRQARHVSERRRHVVHRTIREAVTCVTRLSPLKFPDLSEEHDQVVDDSPEERWDQVMDELDESLLMNYEAGPLDLDGAALAQLDAERDQFELDRNQSMGMLVAVESETDADTTELSSKFVRDWRWRDETCARRSRLVAREFRSLAPNLDDLCGPASISSTAKLLAAMAATSDIYKILFNLPGQRDGAQVWYEFFSAVLQTHGMQVCEVAPAIFAIPGRLALNTHLDDCKVLATRGEMEKLREYLKGTVDYKTRFPATCPGRSFLSEQSGVGEHSAFEENLLETVSDADFASCADRTSTTGSCIFLNGVPVYSTSRRQQVIALTSVEGELYPCLAAVAEGLFLKEVVSFVAGKKVELVHRTDASATMGCKKAGVGRTRHLATSALWIQSKLRDGSFSMRKISGRVNPAEDKGTAAPGTPWFLKASANIDLNSDEAYSKKTFRRCLFEQRQKLKKTDFYKKNPGVLLQQALEYDGFVSVGKLSALDVDMVAGGGRLSSSTSTCGNIGFKVQQEIHVISIIKTVMDFTVDTASNVKDFTMETANNIKDFTMETANDIKDFIMETAKNIKDFIMETVNYQVGDFIEVTESYNINDFIEVTENYNTNDFIEATENYHINDTAYKVNDFFVDNQNNYAAYQINSFIMDKVFAQAIAEMTTTIQG
ncbi:unnamed protein product [Symbiodinium sp. CCMP2456]|nr:unnamed protein product [Symbiodinium sp. CCMP2456]